MLKTLIIACALALPGCKDSDQPGQPTSDVPLDGTADQYPEKVKWLIEEIQTLKPDTDLGSWYRNLWPEPDESLVELEGDAGSLGSASDAIGLGVGDEWILLVDYTYSVQSDVRPIFGARIYRGSVSQALANKPQDNMEVIFPYYWKGEVIRNLADEERQGDWPWVTRQSKNAQPQR